MIGICAAVMALVVGPAGAFGADPTVAQYEPLPGVDSGGSSAGTKAQGGSHASGAAAAGAAAAQPAAGLGRRVGGTLPFTGWDVVTLLGVSVAMLGSGLMMRRLSTPRER
ncbi:MAG: hypothetical protein QOJ38_1287 [Solirubrobacterales bacterium]|jgi:hypothetical protein|nr:hypothetical protein [Solirubrobacterales bacterium]